VLLYLFDLQVGLSEDEREMLEDIRATQTQTSTLCIGNKSDLFGGAPAACSELADVKLSAARARADEEELGPVIAWLRERVTSELSSSDSSSVVSNERHRRHLAAALEAVRGAQRGLVANVSGDVLAIDLRAALHELGSITGEIANEDVLGEIFSRFCIGK
jgi:tRNA modification GTPase